MYTPNKNRFFNMHSRDILRNLVFDFWFGALRGVDEGFQLVLQILESRERAAEYSTELLIGDFHVVVDYDVRVGRLTLLLDWGRQTHTKRKGLSGKDWDSVKMRIQAAMATVARQPSMG